MKKLVFCSAVALISASVFGGAFTPGDLVVVVVGDGTASLSSAAAAATLNEYSTAGSLLQTIGLPTGFTLSGSATSEGFLTLSTSGNYLTMGGYAAAAGTAAVASTAPSAVNRVVARIDMNGNIDTSTMLNDAFNASNIRSVASTDGINLWLGGNAGSGLSASAGPRYTTFGSTTSARINSSTSNMRVVNIFNGQLYVSSSTSGFYGVSAVGTGLPTTAGGGELSLLPGFPTTTTASAHSSYDFWFKDASTLYVADDGAVSAGGGIQKWTFDGTLWTLAYTLLNNGTTTTGVRGLAGTLDGSGNAVLFATSGSALLTVTDTGAASAATTLATAGSNQAFRGVEFLPTVPEPGSAAVLGLGMLGIWLFRKPRS